MRRIALHYLLVASILSSFAAIWLTSIPADAQTPYSVQFRFAVGDRNFGDIDAGWIPPPDLNARLEIARVGSMAPVAEYSINAAINGIDLALGEYNANLRMGNDYSLLTRIRIINHRTIQIVVPPSEFIARISSAVCPELPHIAWSLEGIDYDTLVHDFPVGTVFHSPALRPGRYVVIAAFPSGEQRTLSMTLLPGHYREEIIFSIEPNLSIDIPTVDLFMNHYSPVITVIPYAQPDKPPREAEPFFRHGQSPQDYCLKPGRYMLIINDESTNNMPYIQDVDIGSYEYYQKFAVSPATIAISEDVRLGGDGYIRIEKLTEERQAEQSELLLLDRDVWSVPPGQYRLKRRGGTQCTAYQRIGLGEQIEIAGHRFGIC